MRTILNTVLAALTVVALSSVSEATAQSNSGSHSHMNHGAMPSHGDGEADVEARINSIDADSGTLNVSHGPVEALGWPAMTMDLPVTRRVDLSGVKPGDDVTLTLKQGRDKQYRVIEISPK